MSKIKIKQSAEQRKWIAEFKSANPIVETTCGSGTGIYKWVRYLDGIDMRYGHDTRKGAEVARGAAAMEAWAMHALKNSFIGCPRCHKPGRRYEIDQTGECAECLKRFV